MEGMLCRWALVMQEYDIRIAYCKGSLNINADALSRISCEAAMALPHHSISDLCWAQQEDNIVSKVLHARLQSITPPQGQDWNRHPLLRYRQLWDQIQIVDGVLCRQYTPSPMSEAV